MAAGSQQRPGKAYNSFALDPLEGPALLMLWFRCLTSNPALLILLFQIADLQLARGPTSLSISPACGHLSPHQDKPTFSFQKVLGESLPISLPWYISSSSAFARAGPCCPPHTYSKLPEYLLPTVKDLLSTTLNHGSLVLPTLAQSILSTGAK